MFRMMMGIILLLVSLRPALADDSIKERLRQAREAEEKSLHPKSPDVSTPEPPPEPQNKQQSCPDVSVDQDGLTYYKECHCTTIKYPALDALLKDSGVIYRSQGVIEMGSPLAHLDPKIREKKWYTCGAALDWDPNNAKMFDDLPSCAGFVSNITEKAAAIINLTGSKLNRGCNAHVQQKL